MLKRLFVPALAVIDLALLIVIVISPGSSAEKPTVKESTQIQNTIQVIDENGMVARLIEGVPEGYDFGKADIRDLDSYNSETHYLFQEANSRTD